MTVQELPPAYRTWANRPTGRPQVYVALGTFLSHRDDVLSVIADALRQLDVRAAIALGPTPPSALGSVPADWLVAEHLPQVALLGHADLVIHHGGNNSVQESLAAGARQLVLPFSTDQFANAADLERTGFAVALDPNASSVSAIAEAVESALAQPAPEPLRPLDPDDLVRSVVDSATI